MNHEKCSHQTYSVDLQQDDDHSHDQVHCGSMMQYMQVSNIHNSNRSLGGEMMTMQSPNIPVSSSHRTDTFHLMSINDLEVEHEGNPLNNG